MLGISLPPLSIENVCVVLRGRVSGLRRCVRIVLASPVIFGLRWTRFSCVSTCQFWYSLALQATKFPTPLCLTPLPHPIAAPHCHTPLPHPTAAPHCRTPLPHPTATPHCCSFAVCGRGCRWSGLSVVGVVGGRGCWWSGLLAVGVVGRWCGGRNEYNHPHP